MTNRNLFCIVYGSVIKLGLCGCPILGFCFSLKKCRSFLEVLESLFSAGSSFRCAQFAMTAWCLWERRNRLRVHQRT